MDQDKIMINYCFNFLNCTSSDDLKNIRKNYLYYLHYIEKYYMALYYDFYDLNNMDDEAHMKYHKDMYYLDIFIRLTHDSYLATLLYKLDFNNFRNIIIGLCSYFKCDYYVGGEDKIEGPLKEIMLNNYKEVTPFTKEEYLCFLSRREKTSTHAGDYLNTFSVGSIIEFEKNIISNDEIIDFVVPNPEKKLSYREWKLR